MAEKVYLVLQKYWIEDHYECEELLDVAFGNAEQAHDYAEKVSSKTPSFFSKKVEINGETFYFKTYRRSDRLGNKIKDLTGEEIHSQFWGSEGSMFYFVKELPIQKSEKSRTEDKTFQIHEEIKAIQNNTDEALSIGEIMEKLRAFNTEQRVYLNSGYHHLDGSFGSYRGDYAEMYLGADFDFNKKNTVGEILEILDRALGEGTMEGYKGGTYRIDENTLVNVSEGAKYLGDAIVEVADIYGHIFLISKDLW